ncbi:IQ and ubiquitin-like domain-containing protein [Phymastichus coffea]|uniref:IQ and ubiquitin-like domain-containing protein n=1 Tax=Phymastichus coffea TaxID=108790 RepID=UPI00273C088F|nr:IQ and ubiquitin-like domain-containing protein [Phymastichus coffea]
MCEDTQPRMRLRIVEKDLMRKPQLGGWRNKLTGIVFLNADSQTGPRPKRVPIERTCSRKVQTVLVKEAECQPDCDQATQMWRRDCYIASVSDKYVSAKPYKTYEELQDSTDVIGKATLAIQRCYRAYRILKFVRACARIYRQWREHCDMLQQEKILKRRQRDELDCQALNEPRTLTDLDALVSHLENSQDQKVAAISSPMEQIETRRRTLLVAYAKFRPAREQRVRDSRVRFLTFHCKPTKWTNKQGKTVEMLSLKNQAARQCWQLYELLETEITEVDVGRRMEILLKARSSIDSHDCRAATKFRCLLDQEVVVLAERADSAQFGFLRKRISGAYLQFVQNSHNCTCVSVDSNGSAPIRDYEFREALQKNRMLCLSCGKLLARCRFAVTARKQRIRKCKACVRLHINVCAHVDIKPYEHILFEIRKSERCLGIDCSLVEFMSSANIRHLVLDIWHGRSALSGSANPRDLRLPRFELDQPWSPWNCILLTEDEAEAHACLQPGGKLYGIHLTRLIKSAQRTAKMDFQ